MSSQAGGKILANQEKLRLDTNAWNSQGALCARKSLGNLGGAGEKVIAFVAFGDPKAVWEDDIDFPQLPSGTAEISLCNSAPTDPLCGSPLDDFPSDPTGIVDYLKDVWKSVDEADMNDAQRDALGSLVLELPKQASSQLDTLAGDVIDGNVQRWMLTPEHFWYGMDGSVSKAADDILSNL